ncbi:hypothetical protein AB0O91_16005 [Kitasatospora sp. NPDC089797]|uniref:hypothetical protein n=1 Tax=Kitasatospora sp. NPDC089797 TaxID=3155298 RepID=UPI00341D1897
MSTPNPSEARDALDRARRARLAATESLRAPWWVWAAFGAVMASFLAADDFGPTARSAASLGLGALTVAWVVAGRRSPRVAAVSGTPHRSALPGYAGLPVALVVLVAVLIGYGTGHAVHGLLTGADMPAWIREHPYTTAALPYAVLYVAAGLLAGAVLRRLARRTAAR